MSPASERSGPAYGSGGPFKFLDYYTQADESLFAGRDRELRKVAAELLQGRTYVLYGQSGIGKTSFLLAGLFPGLSRRGYRPIYVRMLTEPLADLRRAIAAEVDGGEAEEDLRALLLRLSAERPAILALDQFEEFFIRFRDRPEVRRRFIETLARLMADPGLDLRILFSLRQDYLGEMDDFRDVLPHLFDYELRLRSLSAFGARRSIASQLDAAGIRYEQQFLIRVVDMLDAFDFDPTILQILCSEVYRRAEARSPEEVRLAAEDLEALGSLREIFVESLDQLAADLPDRLQLTARAVLDSLISREQTKQAVTPADFESASLRAEADDLVKILEALVDHRLVRRGVRGEAVWYELIHERLVPVIREWLDRDDEFLKFRLARNLIDNMSRGEAWRDHPEALAAPGQLDLVDPFRERLHLSDTELEFLFRSAVYRCVGDAVTYWGERLRRDRSAELLAELLRDDEPEVRRGAAWTVRHLPEPRLMELCNSLALQDAAPEVRATARETAAETGSWRDGEELRKALASKETREAAFEGLVSLYRAGKPLPRLNPWRRWWVGRTARRRVVQEHAEELRRCARTGARQGLLAPMAWILAVGVPLVLLTAWALGAWWTGAGGIGGWALAALIGVALPVGAGVGALLGWRLAPTASREWVLRPGGGWFGPVARSGTLMVLMAFLAYLIPEIGCLVPFLLPVLAPVLALAMAALILLVSWAVRPARSSRETWTWSLLAASGLPLLLPFPVVSAVILAAPSAQGETSATIAVGVGALLSFFAFVILRILDRVEYPPDRPTPPRGARMLWARGAAALAVVALLGGYVARVGLDTLPILRTAQEVAPGSSLALSQHLGPGRPDTDYYRVAATAPLTVIRLGSGPEKVPVHLIDVPILDHNAIFMPRSTALLRVGPANRGAPSFDLDYEIELEAPQLLDPGGPIELSEQEWSFARFDLPRVGSEEKTPGKAAAILSGVLAPGSWDPDHGVEVLFFRENPIESGPGGSPDVIGLGPKTSLDLDLVLPELGDTLRVSLHSGFTSNDLPGQEGASHRTTYPVQILEGGRWSIAAFLRQNPESEGDKGSGARTPPGLFGWHRQASPDPGGEEAKVAMIVGLRLTRWAVKVAEHDLSEAERLAREGDAASAGERFADAAGLARDTEELGLNASICREGTYDGFAREVAPACERAVALSDREPFLFLRAVNRAVRDDLAGAAEDLRLVLGRPENRSAQWMERSREWLASLERGENPFDQDTLNRLEREQNWGGI